MIQSSDQLIDISLTRHYDQHDSSVHWKTSAVPKTLRTWLAWGCNKNQSDDFTKPDGSLASNPNDFGHSWVVPGSCGSENVNTDPVPHPCDLNPEKRPLAEESCAILKSELFEGCSDDVDADYEECIFDGCMCPDYQPTCLCDFYAQQGEMCAAKGKLIDWREEITECAIICPTGQKYQICGDSCTRSCDDISANPTCVTRCVDGCNCPPGETLNNNDVCIPIGECPCVLDNTRYPANFTFIEDNNKHTCENALWTISPATIEDIEEHPSVDDLENKCHRDDFLVFSGCKRTNELTCLNKHLNERPNFDDCVSGCECMEGFVMDTELNMCVRPEDCPCIHQGISYPDNTVINGREERCTCVFGFWECQPQINRWEKCSVWGNVHVRSFDENVFTFNGYCQYVLFEHVFNDTGVVRVTVQTGSCPSGSCIIGLFVLYRSNTGQTEDFISLTDINFQTTPNLSKLNITDFGISTIVDVLDFDLRVVWNKDGWVHLHVSQEWLSREHFGLCGKYDNDPSNDLNIEFEAAEVGEFVDYNRNDKTCGKATELIPANGIFPDCNILYTDIFSTCRMLKPVEDYFTRCLIDAENQLNLPHSERTDYYCQTIAAYAQECNDLGVSIDWRSDSICPNTCPLDKSYYPCKQVCTEGNCDEGGMCVEGCGKLKCKDEE